VKTTDYVDMRFKIIALLADHGDEAPRVNPWALHHLSNEIYWAGTSQDRSYQRPDLVEAELENLRVQLRQTAQKIANLDPSASAAANVADMELEAGVSAAAPGGPTYGDALRKADIRPYSEWLVPATIEHLLRLERALKSPISDVIQRGSGLSDGRGAKPNLVARNVALVGAKALVELTGKPVTAYRCEKLAADLFNLFGIEAKPRRVCEWVLSELAKGP
jgi:hypothetical protein